MAICTDFIRLSLILVSTGSMLWMSMLVTTSKQKEVEDATTQSYANDYVDPLPFKF